MVDYSQKQHDNLKIIKTVGIVTIVINLALSLGKFAAGFLGNSMAMVSDAVHSASDVLSTIIVLIGARLAVNRADKDHNYGHEKFESVAAISLAMILFATALILFYGGVTSIIGAARNSAEFVPPTAAALAAAVVSIVVKEGMFWYTRHWARVTKSEALKADAWHHRSDALSSVGSFIGILGAMLGVYVLDGVATLVIALLIVKVSVDIVRDVLRQLTDHAAPEQLVASIRKAITDNPDVKNLDDLKTRISGNIVYVEAEIAVDCALNIVDAHKIADEVHNYIEKTFDDVKHITIHVNPFYPALGRGERNKLDVAREIDDERKSDGGEGDETDRGAQD